MHLSLHLNIFCQDFTGIPMYVSCKLPQKAESTDDPQMQIKSLPSSELSSLHSEVDPSLLPISLGGEQEDKVRIVQDH